MALTPEDFTRLHDRYHKGLFAYLLERSGELETAADLLQETFRRAIQASDSYRGNSEADLRGWLRAIAHNVLADHQRDLSRDRNLRRRLGRSRLALSDVDLERLEDEEARQTLVDALDQFMAYLPADQAEVVRLRVVKDLPYRAIAQQMNSSEQAVRARASRGLRTLRGRLGSVHDAWLDGEHR
jgi:RNA polymerase sigma-70 factor (ECF subfamily)